MTTWPHYGAITGPIVMIGFGSIGRGTLPLIERHFSFDKARLSVLDPDPLNKWILDERGIPLIQEAVTRENYRELLTPLLTKDETYRLPPVERHPTPAVAVPDPDDPERAELKARRKDARKRKQEQAKARREQAQAARRS